MTEPPIKTWVGCEALLDGNPKMRCSLVSGEEHGPVHKRIMKTGRVSNTWPVTEHSSTDGPKGNG